MDINYELYKVFYYVATSLSFSEASKKLFISQSAVSQSVKTLEKKLEQPLFIRSTKKVQLTPAGDILLKHIEPAMNLIARGESQILDSGSLGLGQLHIGASDTICRYLLVPYLQKFHKMFPNVPIKVTNATSIKCVELLDQRKVDLIVTNFPNSHLNHSYKQKTICNFTDVFVANPNYFNPPDIISFAQLKEFPIMMLDRNSTTSEFLHNLFLQHQLELIPEIELSSNDLLIDLAKIGLGVAFVPDYCLRDKNKDLVILKTKEKMPSRQIVVSVNTTLPVSASTEEFLSLLPEVTYSFFYLLNLAHFATAPFPRIHVLIIRLQESFIQKNNYTFVLRCPDNSSGRLEDFIHSRISVCVVKAIALLFVVIIFKYISLNTNLRKTCPNYNCSNKPVIF